MVHLDYRDARPIYTQITDGVRDQIIAKKAHSDEARVFMTGPASANPWPIGDTVEQKPPAIGASHLPFPKSAENGGTNHPSLSAHPPG
jgi:hypothetical protein